jgi:PIN domain nuclease of toxin-antitoxin system
VILLDTHVLLWVDSDSDVVGHATREQVIRLWADRRVGVSAVSFWEAALLARKGRFSLRAPPAAWRADLLRSGFVEHPVDGAIGIAATELEMPLRDPADRLIVATAIAHDLTLVTADRALLRWKRGPRMQDARR